MEKQKTVLITGGARGIGRAILEEFANNGYNVVATYNKSKKQAQEITLNFGTNIRFVKTDITDQKQIIDLVKFAMNEFGKIDILINNAGISQVKQFQDISLSDWNNMIATNLTGAFLLASEVITKSMLPNKSGNIINISSVFGVTGGACEVHYSAAKAGIIGMTKALAKEFAPSNIRVNAISPGSIQTDMLKEYTKQDLEQFKTEIPLGIIGEPIDIANTALFLASDKSKYITGQVINVDGGYLI